jgi:2,4-dienoyl-CoA reductase-like NADH-dependent reductase (Old Yellow Enzyme family)
MADLLFSPIELSGIPLRNRIVHASMTTRMSAQGGVTDPQLRYFANRARGGAAMIVTEPLTLSPLQDVPHKTRAWDDAHMPALQRLAQAVEQHGARLVAQIQDSGRARHMAGKHLAAWAPSALPDDLSWSMPREMRVDEIHQLTEDFAASAHRLQRCGFSGVELSCGHGHLFHQFLSPRSNRREDAYGGSWEGRTRFIRELVQAIRSTCGSRFIVGLKLPAEDGYADSITLDAAVAFTPWLTAGGAVSYVAFAQGTHGATLDRHLPDRFGPREPWREMQRRLRPHLQGVPLMALGRIADPAQASALLEGGEAELVGLGRTLVADPAWPLKAASGRAHDIRYCLSCNTCWESIITRSQTLACVNNPRVAQPDEVDFRPARSPRTRRVVVVGGGLAGLEAAWVAADAGHTVHLLMRGAEPGGQARARSLLPGGEEVSSIYDYQTTAAQRAGVVFETGREAGVDDILARRPDHVVLATGATMTAPPGMPQALQADALVPDLRQALQALQGVRSRQPGTAVLFDMDHSEGTYAAALHLRALFGRVVLLTPRPGFADDMALVTRQTLLRRLAQAGVELWPLSEPVWDLADLEKARLRVRHVYADGLREIDEVALLTYSTPRRRNDALLQALQQRAPGLSVTCVGDCLSPRDMLAATAEGHAAGLATGAA